MAFPELHMSDNLSHVEYRQSPRRPMEIPKQLGIGRTRSLRIDLGSSKGIRFRSSFTVVKKFGNPASSTSYTWYVSSLFSV